MALRCCRCVMIWWLVTSALGPYGAMGTEVPRQAASPSAADTVAEGVLLHAETLEFFQADNRMLARGKVVISYGENRLFADRVELDTASGVGSAWGNVRFHTPQDDITASRLDFNLTSELGLLYDGSGVAAGVYYVAGERIARAGPNTYTVRRGRVTTCSHATPDWEFRAREARIGVGRHVTLKHPSFWIKGVPVFYLPYFLVPLKQERATGILPPRLGYNSTDGAVAEAEFFWAIADWVDATLGVEYLSERGMKPRGEFRYMLDPLSDGYVEGTYLDDRKTDTELWRVLVEQRQELGWSIRGLTHIDLRSEGDVLRRIARDIRQESQLRTASFGVLTKRFPDSTLTLTGASYDGIPDSGNDQQFRRLPTLHFEQFLTSLFNGVLLFGLEASYGRMSATEVEENEPVQRLDFFPQLALPLTFGPWLRATLSGGIRETFYDRQTTGGGSTTRELAEGRLTLEGPTLRRTYAPADGTGAFTHVIAARLDYRYVPRVDQDDLPAFDTLDATQHFLDPFETATLIDRIAAANYAKISLVNRLFAQGMWGAQTLREVGRVVISQGFDIRERVDKDGQLIGPLDIAWNLRLWQRLELDSALRLDPTAAEVDASSLRMAVILPFGWRLHAGHHYRHTPDVQYVLGGVGVPLAQTLRLGYDVRYDGLSNVVREHHVSLDYQAQCWSVAVEARLRDTEGTSFFGGTSVFLRFRLRHL